MFIGKTCKPVPRGCLLHHKTLRLILVGVFVSESNGVKCTVKPLLGVLTLKHLEQPSKLTDHWPLLTTLNKSAI